MEYPDCPQMVEPVQSDGNRLRIELHKARVEIMELRAEVARLRMLIEQE